jgi:hypothetical protein
MVNLLEENGKKPEKEESELTTLRKKLNKYYGENFYFRFGRYPIKKVVGRWNNYDEN